MMNFAKRYAQGAILSIGWGMVSLPAALAQTCVIDINRADNEPLTCAQVYEIRSLNQAITPLEEVLVYKFSPSLADDLGTRLTPGQEETLLPSQILETRVNARAEMQFNEGSLAWLDQRTQFTFRQGVRQVQLVQGSLLVMTTTAGDVSPQPLQVETIGGETNETIARVTMGNTGVFIEHTGEITSVFALTDHPDNPVMVTRPNAAEGETEVQLKGGEMVSVTEGEMVSVMEFDVLNFYRANPLAAILAPGATAEAEAAQRPATVQETLTVVRDEALAVVNAQTAGFRRSFLSEALTGAGGGLLYGDGDSDFSLDAQDYKIRVTTSIQGTYFVDEQDDSIVFFVPLGAEEPSTIFEVNFDDQTVTVDGRTGTFNTIGLSGFNATGTIVFEDGTVQRVEVLNVGNSAPEAGDSFLGTLQEGVVPDFAPDF